MCIRDRDGISRFRISNEVENSKLYRECEVKYDEFKSDLKSNCKIIPAKNRNNSIYIDYCSPIEIVDKL